MAGMPPSLPALTYASWILLTDQFEEGTDLATGTTSVSGGFTNSRWESDKAIRI